MELAISQFVPCDLSTLCNLILSTIFGKYSNPILHLRKLNLGQFNKFPKDILKLKYR